MNEVVWVALISGGSTLAAAVATQFLVARAAAKHAERTQKHEALEWLRSEAKRSREVHEARLQEFWGLILSAQNRVVDLQAMSLQAKQLVPASESASSAAAQAYAIALLGLVALRPLAKDFYHATALVQMKINFEKDSSEAIRGWRKCFEALEVAVAKEVPGFENESNLSST